MGCQRDPRSMGGGTISTARACGCFQWWNAMTSEPEIIACVNGPLLIRGDVELVSSTGEPIPRRRSTIALCRCGASTIKPFCDGSHKVVGFRTEPSGGAAGNGATSESASSDGTVSEGGRKRSHSAKNGTERRGAKRHAS